MGYETLLKRAVADLQAGQVMQAREALRAITEVEPTNRMAWLWYVHSLDDDAKAVEALRQCIDLNPGFEEAQTRLAIYQRKMGTVDTGPVGSRVVPEQRITTLSERAAEKPKSIPELLEAARHDLLDLGLRNPLLNYRLLRARGLEIDEPDVQGVYDALVLDGRTLSFDPIPEPEVQLELGVTSETAGSRSDHELGQPADGRRLRKLQTKHEAADLDKRLLNTYYVSRTYMEEQGVNVLFMAFGMLHWYESSASDTMRSAPLVLVPVAIDRTDVRSQFNIAYTEDEVGYNLSLQSKLKREFGLTIPDLPDEPELCLADYLSNVAQAVTAYERWAVDRAAVALGFFSFATFLMYNDLLEDSWDDVQEVASHPLLNALLGDRGFPALADPLPDDAFVDDIVDPAEARFVLDADSSQVTALLEVDRGHNLVIEGPPGTGKSQTITNLIAESLGQGKTVLFVAEKMAALEVVKRRLDEIGLGKACLELHSHKTNKKAVLSDLQETLYLGQPQVGDYAVDIALLLDHRDRLNAYSTAVNTPIGESSVTPYECYGHLLRLEHGLAGTEAPTLSYGTMSTWPAATDREYRDRVDELAALLDRMGVPSSHPFWAARPETFTPATRRRFVELCHASLRSLDEVETTAENLTTHLGLAPVGCVEAVTVVLDIADCILDGPDVQGVVVDSGHWLEKSDELLEGLTAAERLQELHKTYEETLVDEAWSHGLDSVREAYTAHGRKLWRLAIADYRQARHTLSELCRDKLPRGSEKQLAVVAAVVEAQSLAATVESRASLLDGLVGHGWQDPDADCSRYQRITRWLGEVHLGIDSGQLPRAVVDYLAHHSEQRADLEKRLRDLRDALTAHEKSIGKSVTEIQLDEAKRFGERSGVTALAFTDQRHLLASWAANADRMQEIVICNQFTDELEQYGLGELARTAEYWEDAGKWLLDLYDRTWFEALLDRALGERAALREFDRDIHSRRRETFCTLDTLQFQYNRARLADRHWRHLPSATGEGQMGVLLHEFEKKRRHLPIRSLMTKAGQAIQAIKPVLMMSPLSIAAYLPPGSATFDLVVFDEASQVKPADALGAILRGHQVVVTGDSKQLPPTSFFQSIVELDDDEESPTADLESILGMFRAQGAARKTLKWHYRSRHPSLIAVSNYEFYQNGLLVFPSPDDSGERDGLILHHLPDAVYDRGKSRTNVREAEEVAQAVMQHARNRSGWTLGVAAFSMSQSNAVRDQVEMLRRRHPECEGFFSDHPHEPFFVKNLENVQGDERDVILISVGYGKDANGKMTMNFGPINKEGGERRLNVLITRARHRCEVFSGITADDIDLSRSEVAGVKALKRFLKYAATRDLDVPEQTDHEVGSPFESDVGRALETKGYDVAYQVGSAGFFIDLAIKDPHRPGRYLLGIECDGASYHSARSARDRDRLRQEVLEGLGWQIHRVWSTDWFSHRSREIERLVEVIELAKADASAGGGTSGDTQDPDALPANGVVAFERRDPGIRRVATPRPTATNQPEPYKGYARAFRCSCPLHEVSPEAMSRWVTKVVSFEGPVHVDVLARRITHATGTKRVGSRIQEAVMAGLAQAARKREVTVKGSFVWPAGMTTSPVRDRSALPVRERNIEYVAPEEIGETVKAVVRESVGILADDVAPAACTRLGFGRAGALIVAAVDDVMEGMLRSGVLTTQNGYIVLGEG